MTDEPNGTRNLPRAPKYVLLQALTPRERDVYDAIMVDGLGTYQTAVKLRIRPDGIKNHRKRIRQKLQTRGYV